MARLRLVVFQRAMHSRLLKPPVAERIVLDSGQAVADISAAHSLREMFSFFPRLSH